jgi:crystallin alpha B
MLPDDVRPETVKCTLSSDGVLSIQAPKQQALEQGQKERPVPIERSAQPAIKQGGQQQQQAQPEK